MNFLDYQGGGILKLIVTDTPLETYATSTSANYVEMTLVQGFPDAYVGTVSMAGTVENTNSVGTTDTSASSASPAPAPR